MFDQVLIEAEDYLFPQLSLSVWERVVYYSLIRRTAAIGLAETLVSVETIARATGMSEFKARETIRSLASKGCVKVHDRDRGGHRLSPILPEHITGLRLAPIEVQPADPENIDFHSGRQYVRALLEREGDRCFYCLKRIDEAVCVLDHVIPLVAGGGSGYRNVVASCHGCNALKQDAEAGAFLRDLYRRGILAAPELERRLSALTKLQGGQLKPNVG